MYGGVLDPMVIPLAEALPPKPTLAVCSSRGLMKLVEAGLPGFIFAEAASAIDVELPAVVVLTEDMSAGELVFEVVRGWG